MAPILRTAGQKKNQLDAKFGEVQSAPKLPRNSSQHEKTKADHYQQHGGRGMNPCVLPALPLLHRSFRRLQLSRQLLVLKCCTRAVTQQLGLSGGHLVGLRPPWLHGPHL